MTPDDISDVLRFLAGHWPNPPMTDDEIRVWMMTLSPRELSTATETIDVLSKSGRNWRPTDGEFVAEYRAVLGRVGHFEPPEPLPALEYTTDRRSREEWLGQIRADLSEARGPLVASVSAAVGIPKPRFGNHFATDSRESRALAMAKFEEFAAQPPASRAANEVARMASFDEVYEAQHPQEEDARE